MGLNEQLMEDLKDAMRKRQAVRVSTIRMARAAIVNEAIAKGKPLTDEDVVGVLSRQIKQRRESIEEFTKGNRPELAAREQEELEILRTYMPQQMSREEIVQAAEAVIAQVGAKGPGDFGKVMSKLAPQLKGRAEGQVIADVVRDLLPR
ncbi:MAG: GatB/YqeY domain-containing protein [Chloroflexi bacterium]|nr:GatB/YqeY domain-containing protein [Chloroflexota bacterium]